mmetsp:Transcript_46334/g.104129  ORF Transcript_46334/g.104129 Transcript_46334/m.104129 type:complete len:211 (-) Transcript_46334:82-714(-)
MVAWSPADGPCYLECVEGGSSKFWKCDVAGGITTITFGKVGTSGTVQTKDHGNAGQARLFATKTHQQKCKKGYAPAAGPKGVLKSAVLKKPAGKVVPKADADDIPARVAEAIAAVKAGKLTQLLAKRRLECGVLAKAEGWVPRCGKLNAGPDAWGGCNKCYAGTYFYCCRCGCLARYSCKNCGHEYQKIGWICICGEHQGPTCPCHCQTE